MGDRSGFGSLAIMAKQCAELGLPCIQNRSCKVVEPVDVSRMLESGTCSDEQTAIKASADAAMQDAEVQDAALALLTPQHQSMNCNVLALPPPPLHMDALQAKHKCD